MKWLVPYQGTTWEFDDTRLTHSEARLQKRVTGVTPVAAEAARQELDPDAWLAALLIAMRRAGKEVSEATVIDGDEWDLMAAAEATREAAEVAAKQRAEAKRQDPKPSEG